MKKIIFYMAFLFPVVVFGENIQIKDGLYYSYWVYKDKGVLKEYGVLANKPKKEMGKYLLTPTPDYSAADEIFIKVRNGNPVVYYYHLNSGSGFNTVGWASARLYANKMSISENTIRMVSEDTKELITIGDEFSGKLVKLERNEMVPLKFINDDVFEVDCNEYLEVNDYKDNGLPDYEESDPKGLEGVGLSYPATVFAVNELGICAAFLDESVAPQIKYGWIQFRRIN